MLESYQNEDEQNGNNRVRLVVSLQAKSLIIRIVASMAGLDHDSIHDDRKGETRGGWECVGNRNTDSKLVINLTLSST